MLTSSSQFEHELHKRIAEDIGRLQSELSTGVAVKKYSQYQNYVGQIKALERVLDVFFAEVRETINK